MGDAFNKQALAATMPSESPATLRQQAEGRARAQTEAELRQLWGGMSKDPPTTAKVIEVLEGKKKTIATAEAHYFRNQQGGNIHADHFFNLLLTCAQLERLKELLSNNSKAWLQDSRELQELQKHSPRDDNSWARAKAAADAAPLVTEYAAVGAGKPPAGRLYGPLVQRGVPVFGSGVRRERGKTMVSNAQTNMVENARARQPLQRPNPSSVGAAGGARFNSMLSSKSRPALPNEKPARCERCNEACLGDLAPAQDEGGQRKRMCRDCRNEVKAVLASRLDGQEGSGPGAKCCSCSAAPGSYLELQAVKLLNDDGEYVEDARACKTCIIDNPNLQPIVPHASNARLAKQPAARAPFKVSGASFFAGRLDQQATVTRIRPVAGRQPVKFTDNGLAGVPHQQRKQHNRKQPQPQKAATEEQVAPTSATAAPAQPRKAEPAGGTDANPISLMDTDDEDEAQQQQQQQLKQLHAGAAAAGSSLRSRPATRSAAPSLPSHRFLGLRCLFPPTGGPGSVELTASDLSRLAPDEFLNDTAIDYYLRWLQQRLQEQNPAAAQRCYFFNSFFYKKLTEKNGGPPANELDTRGARGEELTALRNFQQVCKWTRKVDIFDKDYVFVPIHDALHWSLIIICHPGADPAQGGSQRSRRGSGGGGRTSVQSTQSDAEAGGSGDPRIAPTAEPCMLHLDSMRGGHTTAGPANVLRSYLGNEWRAKAAEPGDSVPRRWADAHPGEERVFTKLTIPHARPAVPSQTNHCDCGLFLCAYAELFVHALPPALNIAAVETLKTRYARDNLDLWEQPPSSGGAAGGHATEAAPEQLGSGEIDLQQDAAPAAGEASGGDAPTYWPALLTPRWFPPENASNLRWEMARMMATMLGQSAGLLDANGGFLLDVERTPQQLSQLEALMSELEELGRRQKDVWEGGEGRGYLRPPALRPAMEETKAMRALRLAQKEADAAKAPTRAALSGRRRRRGQGGGLRPLLASSSDDEKEGGEVEVEVIGGLEPAAKRRSGAGASHDRDLHAAAAEQRAGAVDLAEKLFDEALNAGDLLAESQPDEQFGIALDDGESFIALEPSQGPLEDYRITRGMPPAAPAAPHGGGGAAPSTVARSTMDWSEDDVSRLPTPTKPLPQPLPPPGPSNGPSNGRTRRAKHRAAQEGGQNVVDLASSPLKPPPLVLHNPPSPRLGSGCGPGAPWGLTLVQQKCPPPNLSHAVRVAVTSRPQNCSVRVEYGDGTPPFELSPSGGADAEDVLVWYTTWQDKVPAACVRDIDDGSAQLQQQPGAAVAGRHATPPATGADDVGELLDFPMGPNLPVTRECTPDVEAQGGSGLKNAAAAAPTSVRATTVFKRLTATHWPSANAVEGVEAYGGSGADPASQGEAKGGEEGGSDSEGEQQMGKAERRRRKRSGRHHPAQQRKLNPPEGEAGKGQASNAPAFGFLPRAAGGRRSRGQAEHVDLT